MIVFKIGGNQFPAYLTVDSTSISVDSTLISSDATETVSYNYEIKFTPRPIVFNSIKILLKREMDDRIFTIESPYYTYKYGILRVLFNYDFKDKETFEIVVVNEDNQLLWRDKGKATIQDDLQMYSLFSKTTNGKIII